MHTQADFRMCILLTGQAKRCFMALLPNPTAGISVLEKLETVAWERKIISGCGKYLLGNSLEQIMES